MSTPTDTALAQKPARLSAWRWRKVIAITVGAVALYGIARRLPTGTNLSHMDFRAGANSIEFCDPANPQFMPVIAVHSPVAMSLESESLVVARQSAQVVLTLKTSRGKPIASEDLLVVHTQKLHLLIVDPTLTDYQHVHPLPSEKPGEWLFNFTPRRGGLYRVFADFTPVATARGLYASADLAVGDSSGGEVGRPLAADDGANVLGDVYENLGYRYMLTSASGGIRAGKIVELTFSIWVEAGGAVPLQPVMGAYGHLVAFDATRSGFAHLHPNENDLSRAPDSERPKMTFKLTIPSAGRYVIWAQVNLGGHEVFVPFWFEVLP